MESKLKDGLPSSETGIQKHDEQLSVPGFRDLQNDNKWVMPKSFGSSLPPTESIRCVEAVKRKLLQMFRESMDSAEKEYRLCKSKTGSAKNEGPPTTKKTALVDLQNNNNNNNRVVPKSVGSSVLLTESDSSVEAVKLSGTKRPSAESLLSSRHHPPVSNASNAHFVYVRRKHETEPGKCSNDDSTSISANHSQTREYSHHNEPIKENLGKKDSDMLVPEALNIDRSSSECVSRTPAGPLPVAKSNNTFPSPVLNYGQVGSSQPSLDDPKKTKVQQWEERYYQMQNLLQQLDNSSQEGYVQMLRSFSSVELSRHAAELEKISIQLSLAEGREWQRVMLLDVLGKDPKNSKESPTQLDQSEVKGQ